VLLPHYGHPDCVDVEDEPSLAVSSSGKQRCYTGLIYPEP